MKTTLQKWGNSQGIRIPKKLLDTINLSVGSELSLELAEGEDGFTVKLASPRKSSRGRYKLEDLLKNLPKNGVDEEVNWGAPQGEEVW